MARPKSTGLPISYLMNEISKQKKALKSLHADRKDLESKLAKVNAKIAAIEGGKPGKSTTASGRVKNAMSLVEAMTQAMSKKPSGMSIEEIVSGVKKLGYQSNSPAFRGIVNQTLIKEKEKFKNVSRGVYALKK